MDEAVEAAMMQAGAQINALQANERRLIDELAALRKDAERYRWLRAHGDNHCTEKDGYGGQTLKMGDCLDVAVDAAMAPRPAVGAA
jgi:hypothetical protein